MGAINVADILTMQDLANGHLDVKALGEAANGDENTIVTTRTGNTYPSAERAINTMFKNGGLPATPFVKKALMTASALADGKYAQVTDDTINNGLYVKEAGAWVKSAYDPVILAKNYTDSHFTTLGSKSTKTLIDMYDSSFTVHNKTVFNEGGVIRWRSAADTESVLIPVAANSLFFVKGRYENTYNGLIVFFDSKLTDITNIVEGSAAGNDVSFVTVITTKNQIITAPKGADSMLVLRVYKGFLARPLELYLVSGSPILSTENVIDTLDSDDSKMPLSARAGKDIAERLKNLTEVTQKIDSYELIFGDDTTYINGFYISSDPYSSSGYNWSGGANSKLAVLPLPPNITSVNIFANKTQPSVFMFSEEVPVPKSQYHILYSKVSIVQAKSSEMVDIPSYAKYLTVSLTAAGFVHTPDKIMLVRNRPLTIEDTLDAIPESGSKLPVSANVAIELRRQIRESATLDMPDVIPVLTKHKSSVFATHKNFILKDELVDGVSNIFVSRDLGVTWTNFVNTIGKITNFHFFVDGSIMLCGTGKIYTLNSDYTGLIESTVLDHNGSVFIPEDDTNTHHFYSLIYGNQTQYVNGTEVFFWGEYRFSGAIRMWYTADGGRTVKCAVKFGTTIMDGFVRNIRHVHMVTQRRQDEKFYFTTGDHGVDGVENMLITGKYNVSADTWEWKVLATGWLYKFGDIFFDDYYAYLLTDYTSVTERPLSGFYRVAVENLGDFSKYHAIFKPKFEDMGAGTLSRYMEDSNGNKIIFPDNAGHGRLWIARGDIDFKYHRTSPYTSFMNRLGVNDLGDIYSNDPFADLEATGTAAQKLYINYGSHNLTKVLRDAGLTNFMTQRALISDTWIR